MKHKVSELEGLQLGAAVAVAEHFEVSGKPFGDWLLVRCEPGGELEQFAPWRRWEHGGPIVERERIAIVAFEPDAHLPNAMQADPPLIEWTAVVGAFTHYIDEQLPFSEHPSSLPAGRGPTPLIAAMRAYVRSKFGDEVELP